MLNGATVEVSHRFSPNAASSNAVTDPQMTMRFYRGSEETHHDLALVQVEIGEPRPVARLVVAPLASVSITSPRYPDRSAHAPSSEGERRRVQVRAITA